MFFARMVPTWYWRLLYRVHSISRIPYAMHPVKKSPIQSSQVSIKPICKTVSGSQKEFAKECSVQSSHENETWRLASAEVSGPVSQKDGSANFS